MENTWHTITELESMNLNVDNLNTRVNGNGELVIEPAMVGYLRQSGYVIEDVKSIRSVPSQSEKGKAYLVMQVQTYTKPKDHPELDIIEDKLTIPVCSCWSYRQNSSIEPPQGSCKHTRKAYREEKAKADENQTSLTL